MGLEGRGGKVMMAQLHQRALIPVETRWQLPIVTKVGNQKWLLYRVSSIQNAY
jgi:hypothetical protein